MKEWIKGRAGTLAILFAVATVALIVVVCYQAAVLHNQGWQLEGGALLTLVGTLSGGVGGVALTQWSQRSLYRHQSSDQHRLEMRESIASVLDASADLHSVVRLLYEAEEVSQAREVGTSPAGLSVTDSIVAFNDELMAFRENINRFRSQFRLALLVVDQPDLVNILQALGRVATVISLHAESIRDRATANETVDANALDRDLGELTKTAGTLSDTAVARLTAIG